MDEGIVLDRKSFEALAVETRVRILKSLRQRRKTLSELAGEIGMSVSGVKEHLQVLERAELVRKTDDGHKWKYYDLTKKGGDVVAPKELKVWILLSISTVALLMSVMSLFYVMQPDGSMGGAQANAAPQYSDGAKKAEWDSVTAMPASAGARNCTGDTPGEPGNCSEKPLSTLAVAASAPEDEHASPEPDLRMPLAVAVISALALVACLVVLWRNRNLAHA